MGAFKNILFAILVISFITFVALFGRLPALRNTPIAFLHRIIWHHIPRGLQFVDHMITGGRAGKYLSRLAHYLVYEKNPVVLTLFLGLLTGAASIFLNATWSRIDLINRVIVVFLLPQPYWYTYLSARSTGSQIKPNNHENQLRVYPYDHTIYYPGKRCTTCQHLKPARSKHCSICRACISRHDHHCAWVNNCLGRENYRWFLALLASLSVLLPYGAALAFSILQSSAPTDTGDGLKTGLKASLRRFGDLVTSDPLVGCVGLLAGLTGPLAWGLFGYHIYLVWAGTTTNETMKWEDLKQDMAAGLICRGKRPVRKDASPSNGAPMTVEEPPTTWPNSSDQILVHMKEGRTLLGSATAPDVTVELKRCWHLEEITNVYDLGFWDNLREALRLLPS